jgi:hypothetical protein
MSECRFTCMWLKHSWHIEIKGKYAHVRTYAADCAAD